MELGTVELINGIFSMIFVAISIIVGAKIALKYPKFKKRVFLLVGFTWICLVSIWYSSSLSVLLILTTGNGISDQLYMLLGNGLLPITALLWMAAFTDFKYKDKQKILLTIVTIYGALFEIYFLYFLFTDPSVLGEVLGPVDASYNLVVTAYQISLLIILLITSTIFARESMKSDDPKIKLKGKLLLVAFYSFVIGGILEIISHLSIIILIIARLILISSSVEFYPDCSRKHLLFRKVMN